MTSRVDKFLYSRSILNANRRYVSTVTYTYGLYACGATFVDFLFFKNIAYIIDFSGNPCNSRYQCVDGSCISWSKTCTQTAFCRDGTNTPSVCGKLRL